VVDVPIYTWDVNTVSSSSPPGESEASQPITVLMPVRDGQRTVGVTLDSLLRGLSQDDELLVIDDGSIDDTPRILRDLSRRDTRVRVIRVPPTGLVDALNLGLRESSYEWVARADSDDLYPPDRFAVQRAARASGVVLIAGDYSIAGPRGSLGTVPCALGHPFVALSALNPQRIPHPGVMFKRDVVVEAGGYVQEEFPAEDLGLWMRLMRLGTFVGVATDVVQWSMTPGSTSASRQLAQRAETSRLIRAFPSSVLSEVNESSVKDELARYKDASLGPSRQVLLLRDLLSARSLGADVKTRSLLRTMSHQPSRSLTATLRLAYEQRLRRQVRAAFTGVP
jgi:glycosyltransferase involved in cell wall biosynthesis